MVTSIWSSLLWLIVVWLSCVPSLKDVRTRSEMEAEDWYCFLTLFVSLWFLVVLEILHPLRYLEAANGLTANSSVSSPVDASCYSLLDGDEQQHSRGWFQSLLDEHFGAMVGWMTFHERWFVLMVSMPRPLWLQMVRRRHRVLFQRPGRCIDHLLADHESCPGFLDQYQVMELCDCSSIHESLSWVDSGSVWPGTWTTQHRTTWFVSLSMVVVHESPMVCPGKTILCPGPPFAQHNPLELASGLIFGQWRRWVALFPMKEKPSFGSAKISVN